MDFSEVGPDAAVYTDAEPIGQVNFRDRPDGSLNPAGEAGWFLQRERERLGLTLEDASEATGLHAYHLEAIELGDLTRMPNRADALNMVGYYAHYLGFDPEPLIHHYATILPKAAPSPQKAHPANPRPLSSALILKFGKFPKLPRFDFNMSTFPGGPGGAAACLLAAVAIFAGASFLMLDGGDGVRLPQTARHEVQAPAPAVQEQVMPETKPPQEVAVMAPSAAEASADEELDSLTALIAQNVQGADSTAGGSALPASPEATASIAPGSRAVMPAVPAGSEASSRLTLRAKGPVWVRIEDSNGNVVMTQMLMAGDTYQVPDREGLVVIARDGGLLAYLIDGKEKGILGPPGEILVGRPLDLRTLDQPG